MLVSVYIRKEDEDLWRQLPKKTEAISKLLRGQQPAQVGVGETYQPGTTRVPGGQVVVPTGVWGTEPKFTPKPPDPDTGYPCCQKAKPCKHWQWNGNLSAWVNELTGKQREVV